jgi:hypothetical protein
MKTLCSMLILLVACRGPARPVPPSTEASAMAAYDASQYAACATQFTALTKLDAKEKWGHDFYSAACCHARDGKPDAAFAALAKATDAGWREPAWMEQDIDLAGLHADPRWPKAVASAEAAMTAWEKTLKAPELHRQLVAMTKVDQDARNEAIAAERDGRGHQDLWNKIQLIDHENTEALKAAVARYGWPGKSIVGTDGAADAWLLVQHADQDRAFQKQVLALLEPLVKSGEVESRDYAYLYDRVAVAEQRPQRYGTQFKDADPFPIEDEANVDARRKEVGLGTMAEYRKQMEKMYGPLPPAKPLPFPLPSTK